MDEVRHLTEVEVAAYLSRELPASERERIEDHLARCDYCRESVVETQSAVNRSSRPTRVWVTTLVAASVLVVAGGILSRDRPDRLERNLTRDLVREESVRAYPS